MKEHQSLIRGNRGACEGNSFSQRENEDREDSLTGLEEKRVLTASNATKRLKRNTGMTYGNLGKNSFSYEEVTEFQKENSE